jgi:lipopolysaccharide assembly outer membrane protein LptD (OstA)
LIIPYIDAGTLYIQNATLTNNTYYEAKTIKVGKNVTTTQAQGDVNFSQGSYKLIGDQVELHPGTTISLGTTVEIKNNE